MLTKRSNAQERARLKTRKHIAYLKNRQARLSVKRTNEHIYATLVTINGSKSLVASSSVSKSIRELNIKGKLAIAKAVGEEIAKKAVALGIEQIAFDRSGYKYHGRVKAVAEGAREGGLNF